MVVVDQLMMVWCWGRWPVVPAMESAWWLPNGFALAVVKTDDDNPFVAVCIFWEISFEKFRVVINRQGFMVLLIIKVFVYFKI